MLLAPQDWQEKVSSIPPGHQKPKDAVLENHQVTHEGGEALENVAVDAPSLELFKVWSDGA